MHAERLPMPFPTFRPLAMPAAVDGKFGAILLLSLLLHAGVGLWALDRRLAAPDELPTIVATLRLVTASTSASPAHEPSAAPAPAVPPEARQPAARPENRPVPRAMPVAGPTTPPARPPVLAAPNGAASAPAVAVAEAPVVAPSAPPAAEAAPVRAAAPAVSEAMQADAVAAYRRQLAELFARRHEYPRVAAMRGWEGEVRVRLKVARKGNLLGVVLDRSSGYDVLDRHALAMVEDIGGLPALPEALAAGEIQVVVPINYKLRKTT